MSIYICYATSELFVEPTGISIISLAESNPKLKIEKLFILDYGIEDENKEILNSLAKKYCFPMEFIRSKEIIESKRDKFGMSDFQGSMATYSRAFIDLIIPDYVDDLLYIDSDTIVSGDISEIAYFNMEHHVMAAAIGINQYPYKNEPKNDETNTLTGNCIYYACGVVRYSLNNWRKNNCLQMILDTCKKKTEFKFADQTLINNSIPGRLITALPQKYNSWLHELPICMEKKELRRGGFLNDEQIKDARHHPVILHYKGMYFRPWFDKSISRSNDVYYKHKKLSPWRDEPLKQMPCLVGENRRYNEKLLALKGKQQYIRWLPLYYLFDLYRRVMKHLYKK